MFNSDGCTSKLKSICFSIIWGWGPIKTIRSLIICPSIWIISISCKGHFEDIWKICGARTSLIWESSECRSKLSLSGHMIARRTWARGPNIASSICSSWELSSSPVIIPRSIVPSSGSFCCKISYSDSRCISYTRCYSICNIIQNRCYPEKIRKSIISSKLEESTICSLNKLSTSITIIIIYSARGSNITHRPYLTYSVSRTNNLVSLIACSRECSGSWIECRPCKYLTSSSTRSKRIGYNNWLCEYWNIGCAVSYKSGLQGTSCSTAGSGIVKIYHVSWCGSVDLKSASACILNRSKCSGFYKGSKIFSYNTYFSSEITYGCSIGLLYKWRQIWKLAGIVLFKIPKKLCLTSLFINGISVINIVLWITSSFLKLDGRKNALSCISLIRNNVTTQGNNPIVIWHRKSSIYPKRESKLFVDIIHISKPHGISSTSKIPSGGYESYCSKNGNNGDNNHEL